MEKIAVTGNHGPGIRSDCRITITGKDSGGLEVELRSKLESMFGESIRIQANEVLTFFSVQHAHVLIEDSGALPHVIAARLEAAIKNIKHTEKEYLLPPVREVFPASSSDRFRMSRLYLPGNTPSMMINAGIHQPDGIILDLEDSVAPERKDEARILVRNALRNVDFYEAERMVRINQLPLGLEDAAVIALQPVDLILIPKCEEGRQVEEVEEVVTTTRKNTPFNKPVYYMPIIESALGVENAFSIASASENVVAMAIGLEDYTADLGVQRTEEGLESFYARTRLVNACKAAGIQAIDSVYSDVGNMEGLTANVKASKSLGFEGMGCIHPLQIRVIHEGFRPSEEEIDRAHKIIDAFQEAQAKGLGVVSLGTKMIDPPVVKRAEQTLELARKFNSL
ncbi:aldolase/citrate lyase family protein [Bacteroidota bacterium]